LAIAGTSVTGTTRIVSMCVDDYHRLPQLKPSAWERELAGAQA
jgi:hypothetical protein